MRYSLIGCGRIAKNHIKAAISNGLDIVAVCDILPNQMDNLLQVFNIQDDLDIKRYTDFEKLLDELKPELVGIATESGSHAVIALACIDRGINVIIEKPIAMSMCDANEIIKRSEEMGVKVSVCHQNRFNTAIQELKKAIDSNRFGRISHGSINVRWNRDLNYYSQALWRGTWKDDGGCLMNQCIHGIDLFRWMFGGAVDEVYGVTRKCFHDYIETEDVGMAVVKFASGVIGTIEGTVNVYPKNLEETLYIFGERGTVKIGGTSTNNIDVWHFSDLQESDLVLQRFKEETCNVYGNGHSNLYSDVIDAIKNNRKPYIDAVAGRNALELVLAIYKSMKSGQPVKLPLETFASLDMNGMF